jgi:hypothetical protein
MTQAQMTAGAIAKMGSRLLAPLLSPARCHQRIRGVRIGSRQAWQCDGTARQFPPKLWQSTVYRSWCKRGVLGVGEFFSGFAAK